MTMPAGFGTPAGIGAPTHTGWPQGTHGGWDLLGESRLASGNTRARRIFRASPNPVNSDVTMPAKVSVLRRASVAATNM
jgi:hypothetical protein